MHDTIVAQDAVTAECSEGQLVAPHMSQPELSGPGEAPFWQVSDGSCEVELAVDIDELLHAEVTTPRASTISEKWGASKLMRSSTGTHPRHHRQLRRATRVAAHDARSAAHFTRGGGGVHDAVRYVPPVTPGEHKEPREEELEELPPLDGATDEDAESPAPDLEEDEVPEESADPFDDRTGDPTQGDGAAEIELAGKEGGWLDEAEEAEGLDVGDAEILDEEADLLCDNEEPGAGDEDYGLGGEEGKTDQDAGEEGPGDDDEELREEDLPRLDADEGGSPDDEDFVEEGFGNDEGALGVPWSASPWERVGAPLAVGPVRALASVPGGVLAGGAGVFRVDLEGGVERLVAAGLVGGDVTRVWALGGALVVTTEEGGLFVSTDDGATFARSTAWRSLLRLDEAAAGLEVVALTSQAQPGVEIWGRSAQGTLLVSGDQGASFEVVDESGFVAALAVSDGLVAGELVALVRTLRGGELARGRRGALVHTSLAGALDQEELAGKVEVAARGLDLALHPEGKPLSLSLDGGVSWARPPLTEATTVMAWSKGETALLAGLYDEKQERAFLVQVSPRGEVTIVAEAGVSPPDVDGGIQALVADDARGVVWVGGGFGVAAFAPKRP
jgi:hypothetical protein